jgi:hypothetical protein
LGRIRRGSSQTSGRKLIHSGPKKASARISLIMKIPFFALLLFGLFLLGAGCDSGRSGKTSPPQAADLEGQAIPSQADTVAFETAFQQFFRAIQQADPRQFNQFIHPEHGLYIYEQPGAVPHFTLVRDISQFERHFQNQSFFSVRQDLQQCDLERVESLPSLDCEGEPGNPAGYERTGCFLTDGTAFRQNEAYQYAPQPEEEKQQVKQVLPLVQKTVLHTASTHKFHFGYVDGRWYVLFIDLMVPCSA